VRLRCRLGLHRWARYRETDASLANPALAAEWDVRCRDCGAERHAGTVTSLVIFAVVFVVGVLSLAFWSPLVGALLLVGAMGGLMWSMGPAAIEFVARRLSVGR
jgi:hypothetical protein